MIRDMMVMQMMIVLVRKIRRGRGGRGGSGRGGVNSRRSSSGGPNFPRQPFLNERFLERDVVEKQDDEEYFRIGVELANFACGNGFSDHGFLREEEQEEKG